MSFKYYSKLIVLCILSFPRCFQSHTRVTERLNVRFQKWLDDWKDEHISQSGVNSVEDWFMGRMNDLHPCETSSKELNTANGLHRRFMVKYFKRLEEQQQPPAADAAAVVTTTGATAEIKT